MSHSWIEIPKWVNNIRKWVRKSKRRYPYRDKIRQCGKKWQLHIREQMKSVGKQLEELTCYSLENGGPIASPHQNTIDPMRFSSSIPHPPFPTVSRFHPFSQYLEPSVASPRYPIWYWVIDDVGSIPSVRWSLRRWKLVFRYDTNRFQKPLVFAPLCISRLFYHQNWCIQNATRVDQCIHWDKEPICLCNDVSMDLQYFPNSLRGDILRGILDITNICWWKWWNEIPVKYILRDLRFVENGGENIW